MTYTRRHANLLSSCSHHPTFKRLNPATTSNHDCTGASVNAGQTQVVRHAKAKAPLDIKIKSQKRPQQRNNQKKQAQRPPNHHALLRLSPHYARGSAGLNLIILRDAARSKPQQIANPIETHRLIGETICSRRLEHNRARTAVDKAQLSYPPILGVNKPPAPGLWFNDE